MWVQFYLAALLISPVQKEKEATHRSEGGIFGRLKIVPERVFFDYQLSVINNHDENVITTNVTLLSSLRRNEALRNEAEYSEVKRRSKLFFPLLEH